MSDANIINFFINTADFRNEYGWYRIDDGGAVSALSEEPQVYKTLREKDLTRNRSLVLFQNNRGAGVFWGRDAVIASENRAQGDWQGRTFGYTALIEFSGRNDAMEFYRGLLRGWWQGKPAGKPALPELASRVGGIIEKRQLTPDEQLHIPLSKLLERWRGQQVEHAHNMTLLKECPSMALECEERLRELEAYIRYDLPRSVVTRMPSDGVQPLVVVARTLVPERLAGVWRALTDIEGEVLRKGAEWKATGDEIAAPLSQASEVKEPIIPPTPEEPYEKPSQILEEEKSSRSSRLKAFLRWLFWGMSLALIGLLLWLTGMFGLG
jgi:hypothetical protein